MGMCVCMCMCMRIYMLLLAAACTCSAAAVQGTAAVAARAFLACLVALMSGVFTRLDGGMVLMRAVTP